MNLKRTPPPTFIAPLPPDSNEITGGKLAFHHYLIKNTKKTSGSIANCCLWQDKYVQLFYDGYWPNHLYVNRNAEYLQSL